MPEWPQKPLVEVATLQRGFDLPVQARVAGPYPIFAANGTVGTHSEAKVAGPGVVTGRSGSIGKVHYVDGEYWPLNTALWVKDFHGNNPEWVYYLLQWFGLQRFARGGAVPTLNRNLVHSELVPVPPLDEQERIVRRIHECLSRVDEIESLRNKAIAEADQLASSLYAAIANASEWPSKTVGEVVARSRNGKSIRQDNENATGQVLSLSAVHDVSLDFAARKPVVLSDALAEQYRICDGDVFVSRSNTRELVGLSSVAVDTPDARLIYPDLLIKLEVDTGQVLPRYLAYVLRTKESRRQIKQRSVGTSQSMVKISGERLKEVVIPVPPVDVQESLVERFDELHDLTAQLVSEMKSPEQERLQESILRKAFSGEL